MRTDAQIFTDIGEVLSRTAPGGWLALRLDGSIFDDWGMVRLYASTQGGKEDGYDGGTEAHDRLYVLLSELRRAMTVRSQPPWNRVTFRLDAAGKFKVDFQYAENWESDIFSSP